MKQKRNCLKKQIGNKKVGLALGCGSARGLAHIGVIKYLEELEIKIDFITGTSIGALIGGAYASGLSIKEIEDIALKTDLTSTAKLFLPGFSKSGLISGAKIKEFLKTLIGNKKIENLKIPFAAVAANIITGEEILFSKGDLVEAIRASISIPIVFQPVIWNNIVLVDGGLVNPIPINLAREMGAEFIIAVNVMSLKNQLNFINNNKVGEKSDSNKSLEIVPLHQKKLEHLIIDHKWIKNFITHKEKQELPGIKKIFNQSIQIIQEKLIEFSIELYKPDILIEPEVRNINMFDFYKANEIIEKGYFSAKNIK